MRGRSDGATLAREYLDALRHQRRLSPATLKVYGQAIELLFWLLVETELDRVEPAQIRRFVAVTHSKGLAPRSLALMLSAWRGFYHWLVRHRGFKAKGYDCSGAVSYVLHAAGLLSSPLVSGQLAFWGTSGTGNWITVFANKVHT